MSKAKEALKKLLDLFEDPDKLTGTLAVTFIRREGDRPIDRWSWGNRILAWLEGTEDARTFNQWKEAGRSIKKGAHAFYILGPVTVKEKKDDEEEERYRLVGFKGIPVFKVEDTEGDPVPEIPVPPLPPLHEVAEAWNIPIRYAPGEGYEHGHYSLTRKEIVLEVENPEVFFHELVHAADGRNYKLVGGQDPDQETVAEVGAAVLARLYSQPIDKTAWEYVKYYQGDPAEAVRRLLPRIEQALIMITQTKEAIAV